MRRRYPLKLISCLFSIIMFLCLGGCNGIFEGKRRDIVFSLIPDDQSGISFINRLTETTKNNILLSEYIYNGGGVSVGDINNDGLPDLYFTSNQLSNRLYLNKGNLKFEDITLLSNTGGHAGWTNGCTIIDINNDGHCDIYVSYGGTHKSHKRDNQLFINNGDLTFSEQAAEYGLADTGKSTQAAFFDFDKDGDLDMFLVNYLTKTFPDIPDLDEYINKRSEEFGDKLFRNDGGVFKDVSLEAGIFGNLFGFGLGVSIGDLNQDNWPDIYISNDFLERDYLYINNTDGTFTESSRTYLKHMSNFSMGADVADFNNDGLLDIVTLDMMAESNFESKTSMSSMNPDKFWFAVNNGFHYQYMANALQMNMGEGKFSDVANLAGVSSTDWSWAPLLADFDNDGYKDLFVTNGFRRNVRDNDFQKYMKERYDSESWDEQTIKHLMKELIEKMPKKLIPNYMFRNLEGITFEQVTKQWGLDHPSFSNGAVYADLDNDGDLDIVINNLDQKAFLYRNESKNNNHYLNVNLVGTSQNIDGIGARVDILVDGKKQTLVHYLSRGYQSSISKGIHFGLGKSVKVDELTVIWPDGKTQLIKDVDVDQSITLNYKDSKKFISTNDQSRKLFASEKSSKGIDFAHIENVYDDFEKEILLPHKYSQFGPGLAVGDVNNDKLDDFYVGGAMGQEGSLYIQSTDGSFRILEGPWKNHKQQEELSAALFDADNDQDLDMYVVNGGNEFLDGNSMLRDRFYINNGSGTFVDATHKIPDNAFSGSKVRPFDFDSDGDLDLFVGGRVVPQLYPRPASSTIYENRDGVFIDVTQQLAPELMRIGLVTDAIWADYDQDSKTDLIIVGEWMPVTIFRNTGTTLEKLKQEETGLANTEGWWYSIDHADFDNDGDKDLVAGNLGLNYKYKASINEPFVVFANDFDNSGTVDIILSYYEKGDLFPLRGKQCSSQQMPYLNQKFPTYKEFGRATVFDLVDEEALDYGLRYEAKHFASTYFSNNGNGTFTANELPLLAQLSSVNDFLIDDVDNDGNLDIIAAGNMYMAEVETPRNDASYGVYLQGDGKGKFIAKYPYESGLYIDGDVKEIKFLDIDNVKYILAANNNDSLKLIAINTRLN